jgi:hypothetical protein
MNVFAGDFVELKLPCLPSSVLYEAYDEVRNEGLENKPKNIIFFLFFHFRF